MDIVFRWLSGIFFYFVGLLFLRLITGGKFNDEVGRYWIALVGLFVVIFLAAIVIYFIRE